MADLAQFTAQNKFLMLALDHRASIRKMFQSDEDAIQFKRQIIANLQDQFSGVLIDVEYGLPAYKNRTKPFLLPAEKSGYREINEERITELERSVVELKELGADGVKLLLHFNLDGGTAKQQLNTAKKIAEDCQTEDLPFFLEILRYGAIPKQNLVTDCLKYFLEGEVYPDVFKLEYPEDAKNCKQITEILGKTPWILLTAGEDFEMFKSQLQVAVENGCSGFLAGRALWKELFELEGAKKTAFLSETLPARFREIVQITLNT
jgi:tagatose 1,6-diphosphate aldolase